MNVIVESHSDGISSGNIPNNPKPIESVRVIHDKRNKKDEVEVIVNGETIFKYDSKREGCYMVNNIQTPLPEYLIDPKALATKKIDIKPKEKIVYVIQNDDKLREVFNIVKEANREKIVSKSSFFPRHTSFFSTDDTHYIFVRCYGMHNLHGRRANQIFLDKGLPVDVQHECMMMLSGQDNDKERVHWI